MHKGVEKLTKKAANHYASGNVDGALRTFAELAALVPESAELAHIRAGLLMMKARHADALEILAQFDESADTLRLRAKAHEGAGALSAAHDCLRRAAELDPSDQSILCRVRELDDRIGMQGNVVTRTPRQRAVFDLPGFDLLRRGQIGEGFRAVSECLGARFDTLGAREVETVGATVRRWSGDPVRTLVVVMGDGFGDGIQFARYLPEAAARCDRLIVVAYPELFGLLREYECIPIADVRNALIEADCYVDPYTLASLLDVGYGATGAYLTAAPIPLPPGPNVGICWAGNPRNETDAIRSASVDDLAPLRDCNVKCWSLMQRDDGRPDWISPPPIPLTDFEQSARFVAALDLVVAVDTSVAHLAGALGVPVWIALATTACWRWETHATRSNWYDSARLWRQSAAGDFTGVFREMAAAIEKPTACNAL